MYPVCQHLWPRDIDRIIQVKIILGWFESANLGGHKLAPIIGELKHLVGICTVHFRNTVGTNIDKHDQGSESASTMKDSTCGTDELDVSSVKS